MQFPYLAATYVMKNFGDFFYQEFVHHVIGSFASSDKALAAARGAEIHAISSAAKPLAGWLARDAIQECREACGGHGYLRAAGIGPLRDDNDSNCTYEVGTYHGLSKLIPYLQNNSLILRRATITSSSNKLVTG